MKLRFLIRMVVAAVVAGSGVGSVAGCNDAPLFPDSPDAQQSALVGCAERVLYAIEPDRLVKIGADGTRTTLHQFGADLGLPPEAIGVFSWQRAGQFVAAYATIVRATEPLLYELVVADENGVRFVRRQSFAHNPEIFLGADGSLAVAGDVSWLRRASGDLIELAPYQPIGPMLGSDLLPVANGNWFDAKAPKGLLRVTGERSAWELVAFVGAPSQTESFKSSEQFVFLHDADLAGGPQQVIAVRASETIRVALTGREQISWQILAVAGERFVLLGESTEGELVLVDLEQRSITPIAGSTARSRYGEWTATVDEEGRVFVSTLDAETGTLRMRRTDDAGASYEQVGVPMAPGENLGFAPWLAPIAHHGRALVMSLSTGYGDMLNGVQFTGDKTSTVIAGGGYYLGWSPSPLGEMDLSSDGQCGAAWVLSQGKPFSNAAEYSLVLFDDAGPRTALTSTRPAAIRFAR